MRNVIVKNLIVFLCLFYSTLVWADERNCDPNQVPFALDINKIYQPQFTGWHQYLKGESVSIPLVVGNTQPQFTYVIEVNDLPDGLACTSNPPKVIGNVIKAGTWYSRYWVHITGSSIKTDFNRGVIVINVVEPNDLNQPYIEMNCGN